MKKILCVLCLMALAGCGNGLSGTYAMGGDIGGMSYTFKSGSKVVQTTRVMGMEKQTELSYTREGDKIRIGSDDESGVKLVLSVMPDGSLQGPLGVKYLKKD